MRPLAPWGGRRSACDPRPERLRRWAHAGADGSPSVLRPPRCAYTLLDFSALTLGAEMKPTTLPPTFQSVRRDVNILNL